MRVAVHFNMCARAEFYFWCLMLQKCTRKTQTNMRVQFLACARFVVLMAVCGAGLSSLSAVRYHGASLFQVVAAGLVLNKVRSLVCRTHSPSCQPGWLQRSSPAGFRVGYGRPRCCRSFCDSHVHFRRRHGASDSASVVARCYASFRLSSACLQAASLRLQLALSCTR